MYEPNMPDQVIINIFTLEFLKWNFPALNLELPNVAKRDFSPKLKTEE